MNGIKSSVSTHLGVEPDAVIPCPHVAACKSLERGFASSSASECACS